MNFNDYLQFMHTEWFRWLIVGGIYHLKCMSKVYQHEVDGSML